MKPTVALGLFICAILICALMLPRQHAGLQSVVIDFLGRNKINLGRLEFTFENNGPAPVTLDGVGYEIKSPPGVLIVTNYVDFGSPGLKGGLQLEVGESMTISLSDLGVDGRARLIYAVDMSLQDTARIYLSEILPKMIKHRIHVNWRPKVSSVSVSDWIGVQATNQLSRMLR